MYEYGGHTDCDAPLGVVVHQNNGESIRLPVIDDGLQLYERKVGPTSLTRRGEVTVPIEGLGSDNWLQYVNAFDSTSFFDPTALETNPNDFTPNEIGERGVQQADVIGQPIDGNIEPVGEPVPLFRGYVAAVGSKDGVNRAQFRIQDPKDFLSQIEAGTSFSDATVTDVLKYVRNRFVKEQSVFTTVAVDRRGEVTRPATQMLTLRNLAQVFVDPATLVDDPESVDTPSSQLVTKREKQFSTNRDTLTDVINWLTNKVDIQVFFVPNGQRGLTLVGVSNTSSQYDLDEVKSPPATIKNNALYEMRPFNGLKLKGQTGPSIVVGDTEVKAPWGDTYTEAVATYEPLVERFGDELVKPKTTKYADKDLVEREARSQLKNALDEVSGGSMTTTLAPMCRPYDTVKATPACSGVTADVDSLTYEIQEAVHSVVPADNNVPRTTLSVSMAVDEDITVRSTIRDSQTGGKPSNRDVNDDYAYGPGAP